MDREGLGRALGFGARQAARTLVKIADAATAPAAPAPRARQSAPPERPVVVLKGAARQARGNAKGLSKAVFTPVAKFTSVLWLEVTGLFYAVFAVILGMAAWRQWGLAFAPGATAGHSRFFIYIGVGAVFAYFSATNFLKAQRRSRR